MIIPNVNPDLLSIDPSTIVVKSSRRANTSLQDHLYALLSSVSPMTVRQCFYQAVVRSLVEKTEGGYHQVQRALRIMRDDEIIPYDWINDHSRTVYRAFDGEINPPTVAEAVRRSAYGFTRSFWQDMPYQVDLWCEKQALLGPITPITDEYRINLFVPRGFASRSYQNLAVEAIAGRDVKTVILYLADYDPSGQLAAQSTRQKLFTMLRQRGSRWGEGKGEDTFGFKILALTPDQISTWRLPTRPTKDSKHKGDHHEGDSVELDAIPPREFEKLIRDELETWMPKSKRDAAKKIEQDECAKLLALANELVGYENR